MATKTHGKKWTHKTPKQLRAMTHEQLIAHGRAVLADAAARDVRIDWTAIALRIIGDAPAHCRSARHISAASGIPRKTHALVRFSGLTEAVGWSDRLFFCR